MGTGFRIFFVNDDDSLQRISLALFERLCRRDPEDRLPQYAGKQVRYALVILEVENRKPEEIFQIHYAILPFDSEGRIDVAAQKRERRLAMEVLPPTATEQESRQVVDARHLFAKKRYNQKYKWTPSPEMEEAIVYAIFGKK